MHYEDIAQQVISRLFVELEASGRHVHVTEAQAQALFGHRLTPKRELSQPGQYLANERVTVIGPKGRFDNVAVLGPERKAGQVELFPFVCLGMWQIPPAQFCRGRWGRFPSGRA